MEHESGIVAEVAELAKSAEIQSEITDNIVSQVLENAEERIERAERTAEEIAAAAMESARGQEIQELRRDFYKWQEENQTLAVELHQVKSQLSEMSAQLAALATLEILSQTAASSSLIPPQSGAIQEATEQTLEILPGNLGNVVAENPEPVPPAIVKRKRLI